MLATSLSTFAVGLLAGWGLFYEAAHTICIQEVELSTGIQIIATLVVGFAAVYVPWQIASNERNRRMRVFSALLRSAVQATFVVSSTVASAHNFNPKSARWAVNEAQRKLHALESYPVADTPSAELLVYRTEAQIACQNTLDDFSKIFNFDGECVVSDAIRTKFNIHNNIATRIFNELPQRT